MHTRAVPYTFSSIAMDTHIIFQAVTPQPEAVFLAAAERAMNWFRQIERSCSRFDHASELMLACRQVGTPVKVSPLLIELLYFALNLAQATGGVFDPAIGGLLQQRGFNTNYITGERMAATLLPEQRSAFHDVLLDRAHGTITLLKPLVLDLGAVAKGLAIDLAARELAPLENYAIDAGGDLYVQGTNRHRTSWRVGIRHPRCTEEQILTLAITDMAVCTSGDYERRSSIAAGQHHLVDPQSGKSPAGVASVTVIAPSALVADALSTAAFILGPKKGLQLMEEQGVDGCIITHDLAIHPTRTFRRYLDGGHSDENDR